jgi:hypothetical protein
MSNHGPTEDQRGHFIDRMDKDEDGRYIYNVYDCANCVRYKGGSNVINIAHGYTDDSSHWGRGVATTRRECDTCGRWDGPWVSSGDVGGGW